MNKKLSIILIILNTILVLFLISILVFSINNNFFKKFDKSEAIIVKEKNYQLNDIKKIDISLTNSDIKIIETDSNELRIVEYSNKKTNKKYLFNDHIEGTSIEIDSQRNFCFMFCFFNKTYYEIYIPKTYKNELYVKTVSGEIETDTLNLSKTTIKTTSGSIKTNDIMSNYIEIKTVSGNIKTNNLTGKEIILKTTSGKIEANNIEANTSNIKTVSGNFKTNQLYSQVDVSITSGNIRINDLNVFGNSSLKAVSGNINVGVNSNIDCKFELKTTTGDKFADRGIVYNNQKYIVNVKTTSGNINIK